MIRSKIENNWLNRRLRYVTIWNFLNVHTDLLSYFEGIQRMSDQISYNTCDWCRKSIKQNDFRRISLLLGIRWSLVIHFSTSTKLTLSQCITTIHRENDIDIDNQIHKKISKIFHLFEFFLANSHNHNIKLFHAKKAENTCRKISNVQWT